MLDHDLDLDLTEDERAVRHLVHRFALDVMRPAGRDLDRLDGEDVIAKGSLLWDVHRRWDELGVRLLSGDTSGMSPASIARLSCVVNEELGWGDSGLAVSIGAAEFPAMLARASQNPELMEAFPTGGIGCWAITEPDHGSDELDWSESDERPTLKRPNCVAERCGDDYVIRGQKAAWVSNGTIATSAALYTAVDEGDGIHGCGVVLVDLTSPGVSRGKPLDKIGQRALPQGEIFFEDVRVPARNLVVPPAMYPMMLELTLCTANGFMGATFAGVARAAFEHAVEYTKQRIQGGVPIFSHQSVRASLFEMFRKVETARALSRRVVLYNTVQSPLFGGSGTPAVEYAIASKVTSTQAAFEVASQAVQLFGGNGLSREYPVEKLMRDARASMIEDGVNEVLGLHAAEKF